jgi:hypothetical protein
VTLSAVDFLDCCGVFDVVGCGEVGVPGSWMAGIRDGHRSRHGRHRWEVQ